MDAHATTDIMESTTDQHRAFLAGACGPRRAVDIPVELQDELWSELDRMAKDADSTATSLKD